MENELKFGLSSAVLNDFVSVFKKFPKIQSVLIFGSRAKNTYREGSDIDLAVIAPTMDAKEFSRLWGEIEDLPLAFKVDLLHFEELTDQTFKEKIVSEGKILY